jgi:hypothetical protein
MKFKTQKFYVVMEDKSIKSLEDADLTKLAKGLTGNEALKIAKENNKRIPFKFEVIENIDLNEKLNKILIDWIIFTGDVYKDRICRLYLDWDLVLDSFWDCLADSDCDGRVVLVDNVKPDISKSELDKLVKAKVNERMKKMLRDLAEKI